VGALSSERRNVGHEIAATGGGQRLEPTRRCSMQHDRDAPRAGRFSAEVAQDHVRPAATGSDRVSTKPAATPPDQTRKCWTDAANALSHAGEGFRSLHPGEVVVRRMAEPPVH
jgi:hypothetical protein